MPKPWIMRYMFINAGLRINFDHQGFFNVHLNVSTQAFFSSPLIGILPPQPRYNLEPQRRNVVVPERPRQVHLNKGKKKRKLWAALNSNKALSKKALAVSFSFYAPVYRLRVPYQ